MAGSADYVALVEDYRRGSTLVEVAAKYGLGVSTARYHVRRAGALRSVQEALRLAASKGRFGSGRRGKRGPMSEEQKRKLSDSRLEWAEENAVGFSIKPSGYVEYTRGPNKGRSEHVVMIERRIGRRLIKGECVHHIDGDRSNNSIDNLALMTISGHARLHRREDALAGRRRERKNNGCFS